MTTPKSRSSVTRASVFSPSTTVSGLGAECTDGNIFSPLQAARMLSNTAKLVVETENAGNVSQQDVTPRKRKADTVSTASPRKTKRASTERSPLAPKQHPAAVNSSPRSSPSRNSSELNHTKLKMQLKDALTRANATEKTLNDLKEQNSELQKVLGSREESLRDAKTKIADLQKQRELDQAQQEKKIKEIEQDYFFALVRIVKQEMFANGVPVNKGAQDLYDAAITQSVPYSKWRNWIETQFSAK